MTNLCSKTFLIIVIVYCFLLASIPTFGFDLFLYLEGIQGESSDSNHIGWIDCKSSGFYLIRFKNTPITYHFGVTINKYTDRSTPLLQKYVHNDKIIPCGNLDFIQSDGLKLRFYQLSLSNIVVNSGYQGINANSTNINDSFLLTYDVVRWTYTEYDTGGNPTGIQPDTYWDIPLQDGGDSTNDLDGDGIPNINDNDDDGDGVPDIYEVNNCMNMHINDAYNDNDNDGMSNIQEFIAGTSACNSNDCFKVTYFTTSNNLARLTWSSKAGKKYRILQSSSPTGTYAPIGGLINSISNDQTSTNFPASSLIQFFRVQVQN